MSYQPYVDPVGMDPRHYGFADSVKRGFSQYAKFDGVASVAEFWWFYLFNLIVFGVLLLPGVCPAYWDCGKRQ